MDEIERRYFKIGEVATMLGEDTVTVRFWCNYFDITTHRGSGLVRKFTPSDVVKLQNIQNLLRVEGRKLWKVKEMI